MPMMCDQRLRDLAVTKFKIAMLLEDAEIRTNFPEFAQMAFDVMLKIDSDVTREEDPPPLVTVVYEDKYKQARN